MRIMGYWLKVFSKAWDNTWGLMGGTPIATIMIAAAIFVISILLVRHFKGDKSVKEWTSDTLIGVGATVGAGLLVFVVQFFFIAPKHLYEEIAIQSQNAENAKLAAQEDLKKLNDERPVGTLKKRTLNFSDGISEFAHNWPPTNNAPVDFYSAFTSRYEQALLRLQIDLEREGARSDEFDRVCRFPSTDNDPNAFSPTNALRIAEELKRLAKKL